MHSCRVRYLLMGGQACALHGAAEFSRDTDIVILADGENLERLNAALAALEAECTAVPRLQLNYLSRGHAIHFRCHHPEADRICVDVMSVLRDEEERIRAEDRAYWAPLRKELEQLRHSSGSG